MKFIAADCIGEIQDVHKSEAEQNPIWICISTEFFVHVCYVITD